MNQNLFFVLPFLLLSFGYESSNIGTMADVITGSCCDTISPVLSSSQSDSIINQKLLKDLGFGPITSLVLEPVDSIMVEQGKNLFDNNCLICHKLNKRYIGPSMNGLLSRRSPEWIMNMIINPVGMVENNPIAIQLLKEYSAPMPDQKLTLDEVRAILEYLRTLE